MSVDKVAISDDLLSGFHLTQWMCCHDPTGWNQMTGTRFLLELRESFTSVPLKSVPASHHAVLSHLLSMFPCARLCPPGEQWLCFISVPMSTLADTHTLEEPMHEYVALLFFSRYLGSPVIRHKRIQNAPVFCPLVTSCLVTTHPCLTGLLCRSEGLAFLTTQQCY